MHAIPLIIPTSKKDPTCAVVNLNFFLLTTDKLPYMHGELVSVL